MNKNIIIISFVLIFGLIVIRPVLALETEDFKGILNEEIFESVSSLNMGNFIKKGSDFIKEQLQKALDKKDGDGEESEENQEENNIDISIINIDDKLDDIKNWDWKRIFEKLFNWFFIILKSIFNLIKSLIVKI